MQKRYMKAWLSGLISEGLIQEDVAVEHRRATNETNTCGMESGSGGRGRDRVKV